MIISGPLGSRRALGRAGGGRRGVQEERKRGGVERDEGGDGWVRRERGEEGEVRWGQGVRGDGPGAWRAERDGWRASYASGSARVLTKQHASEP